MNSNRYNVFRNRGVKMATKEQFLRDYIKAIRSGNAAVFGGAGLFCIEYNFAEVLKWCEKECKTF